MLNWLSRFNICCLLDDHGYEMQPHYKDCIAAAGSISVMPESESGVLEVMDRFVDSKPDWIFGHLGYGLKDEIQGIRTSSGSPQADNTGFPTAFFFVPRYVLILREGEVQIGSLENDHGQILEQIQQPLPPREIHRFHGQLKQRVTRQDYLDTVGTLQAHIHRGDCYEINYCQEFYAEDVRIDPEAVYATLTKISPTPFSAFYRLDNSYLLCASPERFLSKKGQKLVSQPIKGTIARDLADPTRDLERKAELEASLKDRSENVMVVDLVRNDLSRVCRQGSVKVDELFGVYAFPQVYQMISTVSGELENDAGFGKIIEACFPMGSMTGAPKRKVMELIDRYERSPRGIFSGSLGYISPEKDFDFNVVIRSIMYNASTGYLSYWAGSGITAASDPESEYEECMVKARAMEEAIRGM